MHIHIKERLTERTAAKKTRHPAIIYLGEYRAMQLHVDALKQELRTVREIATNASVRADADRVTGSGARDSMANHAVRTVDVQRRLDMMIEHLQECLDIRLWLISQIDAGDAEETRYQKLVLTYRYVNCMLWEDIQHKLNYGATATYELHGRALQSFWKVHQKWNQNSAETLE